jgi:hypothetical protein
MCAGENRPVKANESRNRNSDAASGTILKGHGNEPNFPRFLHKSVGHGSVTLPFEPFRLLLRIRGDIRNGER